MSLIAGMDNVVEYIKQLEQEKQKLQDENKKMKDMLLKFKKECDEVKDEVKQLEGEKLELQLNKDKAVEYLRQEGDFDDKYHSLVKPLDKEIKYKISEDYSVFEEDTIIVDTVCKLYDDDKKPVSIYWDYNNDIMDTKMWSHYSAGENHYDNHTFLDFTWMKVVKDKYWKKGEKMAFWHKSNGDGYFNIWIDRFGRNKFSTDHYLDEEGFIYINLFTRKFNYEKVYEKIDCHYNRNLNVELGRNEYD